MDFTHSGPADLPGIRAAGDTSHFAFATRGVTCPPRRRKSARRLGPVGRLGRRQIEQLPGAKLAEMETLLVALHHEESEWQCTLRVTLVEPWTQHNSNSELPRLQISNERFFTGNRAGRVLVSCPHALLAELSSAATNRQYSPATSSGSFPIPTAIDCDTADAHQVSRHGGERAFSQWWRSPAKRISIGRSRQRIGGGDQPRLAPRLFLRTRRDDRAKRPRSSLRRDNCRSNSARPNNTSRRCSPRILRHITRKPSPSDSPRCCNL